MLLGREDMALSVFRNLSSSKEFEMQSDTSLISMSIPYMLHLHPVIVPSSLSESTGMENTKIEDTSSVDGSVIDGMEHIFNSYTQLRYGRDLRLNEVCLHTHLELSTHIISLDILSFFFLRMLGSTSFVLCTTCGNSNVC